MDKRMQQEMGTYIHLKILQEETINYRGKTKVNFFHMFFHRFHQLETHAVTLSPFCWAFFLVKV